MTAATRLLVAKTAAATIAALVLVLLLAHSLAPQTLPFPSPLAALAIASVSEDAEFDDRAALLLALNRTARQMERLKTVAPSCPPVPVGSGAGVHSICKTGVAGLARPCKVYSFGVSNNWSFDTELGQLCSVVALDPSVTHQSKLAPNVHFLPVGARTLNPVSDARWALLTTLPRLRHWLGDDRVAVLKMDCEGCEYALAEDILQEDPTFFDHVEQFAVEIHVSRVFMTSPKHGLNLGRLFLLLERSGLQLIEALLGPCGPPHETSGCTAELVESGYPCGPNLMCQNLLFARIQNERQG